MDSIDQIPQLRNFRTKTLTRMLLASRDNPRMRQTLEAKGWTADAIRRELIARECAPGAPQAMPSVTQWGGAA